MGGQSVESRFRSAHQFGPTLIKKLQRCKERGGAKEASRLAANKFAHCDMAPPQNVGKVAQRIHIADFNRCAVCHNSLARPGGGVCLWNP